MDAPYTVRVARSGETVGRSWTYAEAFAQLTRIANSAYGRSEYGRSYELCEHTPSGGILILMRIDVLPGSEG